MLDSPRLLEGYRWYVIRVHHWQESRAEANLSRGGIETFLPWAQSGSRRRRKGSDREALFPQYLFARFDPAASFHDVTFTRGVQGLVRVGGQLATVDDDLIEFFRSCVDEHGLIPVGRKLEPGVRVTIQSGPFMDLAGIVERSLPARERVIVLLTSIGSQLRVEVPADHIRACEGGPLA
jgi:transcriptional antiterminator RfaH